MKTKERKLKLIKALEKERDRLQKQGKNVIDHNLTISYLNTGIVNTLGLELEAWEILAASVDDFDMLYNDYCVL